MFDARAAFRTIGQALDGCPRDKVIDIAANLMLNMLRQSHPRLAEAQEELDEITAKLAKALAAEHYTPEGNPRHGLIRAPGIIQHLEGLTRLPH